MAQDEGDNGNTVTQMLVDFQYEDAAQGGLAIVTILHFSEDSDEIQVETYSTAKKQYYKPRNQFTFTLDFVGEDPIDESPAEPDESVPSSEESEVTKTPEESEAESSESTAAITTESSTLSENNGNGENNSNGIIIIVSISAATLLALTAIVIIIILKKKKK
jgi:hypothetical protein